MKDTYSLTQWCADRQRQYEETFESGLEKEMEEPDYEGMVEDENA